MTRKGIENRERDPIIFLPWEAWKIGFKLRSLWTKHSTRCCSSWSTHQTPLSRHFLQPQGLKTAAKRGTQNKLHVSGAEGFKNNPEDTIQHGIRWRKASTQSTSQYLHTEQPQIWSWLSLGAWTPRSSQEKSCFGVLIWATILDPAQTPR